jgi:hypothetical protein
VIFLPTALLSKHPSRSLLALKVFVARFHILAASVLTQFRRSHHFLGGFSVGLFLHSPKHASSSLCRSVPKACRSWLFSQLGTESSADICWAVELCPSPGRASASGLLDFLRSCSRRKRSPRHCDFAVRANDSFSANFFRQ